MCETEASKRSTLPPILLISILNRSWTAPNQIDRRRDIHGQCGSVESVSNEQMKLSKVSRMRWKNPESLGKIFARYAMAVVFVSASFLLRFALIRYFGLQLPPFIVCSPAIMLVALLVGLGPGLLATVLGMLGTAFLVMSPVGSFALADRSQAFALALFGATGVFMSLVADHHRRSRRLIASHKEEQALRRSEEELRKASEYRHSHRPLPEA